jgi:hypothetical protein
MSSTSSTTPTTEDNEEVTVVPTEEQNDVPVTAEAVRPSLPVSYIPLHCLLLS